MKTVQYYLNNLDLEKLTDTYFNRIKSSLLDEDVKNISIEKMVINAKFKIKRYIKKLQDIQIKTVDNQGILLASEGFLFETLTEPVFSLVFKNDILQYKEDLSKVESYAYELTPDEEILGFLVSDGKYTQNYIYELIADVLYEASFFGYNNEAEKTKIKEELKQALEEIKLGEITNFKSWNDYKKEISSDVYIYENDDYQKELIHNLIKSIHSYNTYSRTKELNIVLKELEGTKN